MRFLLVAGAALALSACASLSTDQVRVGMTEAELSAVAGSPFKRSEDAGGAERLTYRAKNAEGRSRHLIVTVRDGVVANVEERDVPKSSQNRDRSGDTGGRL